MTDGYLDMLDVGARRGFVPILVRGIDYFQFDYPRQPSRLCLDLGLRWIELG